MTSTRKFLRVFLKAIRAKVWGASPVKFFRILDGSRPWRNFEFFFFQFHGRVASRETTNRTLRTHAFRSGTFASLLFLRFVRDLRRKTLRDAPDPASLSLCTLRSLLAPSIFSFSPRWDPAFFCSFEGAPPRSVGICHRRTSEARLPQKETESKRVFLLTFVRAFRRRRRASILIFSFSRTPVPRNFGLGARISSRCLAGGRETASDSLVRRSISFLFLFKKKKNTKRLVDFSEVFRSLLFVFEARLSTLSTLGRIAGRTPSRFRFERYLARRGSASIRTLRRKRSNILFFALAPSIASESVPFLISTPSLTSPRRAADPPSLRRERLGCPTRSLGIRLDFKFLFFAVLRNRDEGGTSSFPKRLGVTGKVSRRNFER